MIIYLNKQRRFLELYKKKIVRRRLLYLEDLDTTKKKERVEKKSIDKGKEPKASSTSTTPRFSNPFTSNSSS